jgi:hypothetical protein
MSFIALFITTPHLVAGEITATPIGFEFLSLSIRLYPATQRMCGSGHITSRFYRSRYYYSGVIFLTVGKKVTTSLSFSLFSSLNLLECVLAFFAKRGEMLEGQRLQVEGL